MRKTHLVSIRSKFHETYSFVMTFSIFKVHKNIYFDARAYNGVHKRLTIGCRKKLPDERKTKTYTKTFQNSKSRRKCSRNCHGKLLNPTSVMATTPL